MSIKYDKSWQTKGSKKTMMIFKAEVKTFIYTLLIFVAPGGYLTYSGFTHGDIEFIKGGVLFLALGTAFTLILAIKGKEWLKEKLEPYF